MGTVIWFTGLPCSGKTTLAKALEDYLEPTGITPAVIDGDMLRDTICSDLGFSEADRVENNRRAAELACYLADLDIVPLVAMITPTEDIRSMVKKIILKHGHNYVEIFVKCPLQVCARRDVKKMYWRARRGLIKDFTGISAPFDVPRNPDIIVETDKDDIDEIINDIAIYLVDFLPI